MRLPFGALAKRRFSILLVAILCVTCTLVYFDVIYLDELFWPRPPGVPISSIVLYDDPSELATHAVFRRFNITVAKPRERADLVLIVSSAPKRFARRQAIRQTWWKQCNANPIVNTQCFFFTDRLPEDHELFASINEEIADYGDVVLQKEFRGVKFGDRFLYHMVWAEMKFDYEYLMRMDDDVLFCAERFLSELPLPAPKYYHWGWVHCKRYIVRPEESVILLSQGLIKTFLSLPSDKLLCHPLADQMIAVWINQIDGLDGIYHHDDRIYHGIPASLDPCFSSYKEANICEKYIAVHGSYPETMTRLWALRGESNTRVEPENTLLDYGHTCSYSHFFRWHKLPAEWRYKPKLCIDDPSWDTTMLGGTSTAFGGREEAV